MNLGSIWEECGRLLNDPLNSRWSQAILTTRANEAAGIIQGYTDALITPEALTVTANSPTVNMDADVMDIIRVVIIRPNGDSFPLEGTTELDMDFNYPDYLNWDAGEPKTWFYRARNQTIVLIPKPDANNVVADGLEVYAIRKPVEMTSASDIPFDANNQLVPYHYAIVAYVVARCWLDDGTPEALGKSKFFRSGSMSKPGEFENEIMRINAEFNNPQVAQNIKFRKQGGRLGSFFTPTKSDPLAY